MSVAPLDPDSLLPTRPTEFGPRVYAHQWEAGDLIVWDNGYFAHSTTPVEFYRGERKILQIMFSGERAGVAGGSGRLMNPGGGQGTAQGEEDARLAQALSGVRSGLPSTRDQAEEAQKT